MQRWWCKLKEDTVSQRAIDSKECVWVIITVLQFVMLKVFQVVIAGDSVDVASAKSVVNFYRWCKCKPLIITYVSCFIFLILLMLLVVSLVVSVSIWLIRRFRLVSWCIFNKLSSDVEPFSFYICFLTRFPFYITPFISL